MQAGVADLIHDAVVLHRLADFIEEYCREQERSQRYIDPSGEFFRYAERLAWGIKDELCHQVKRSGRFPPGKDASRRINALRQNVLTLKAYLKVLHTLIKPAADAHTLSIPAPLIDLAHTQLQGVEGMKGSRVVVLLTPHLMYFQRPHTNIKTLAQEIQRFIPSASFPPKLGFIELPYSQGPSFFTNLVIYHEIGHVVYEQLSTPHSSNRYFKTLRSVQDRSLAEAFPKPSGDPETRAFAEKMVESWTQEIFCDLFAIRLVGPAFSFALVEMLGMLDFLSTEGRVKFDEEHPASACRFAEHINLLREDNWWEAIAHANPEQKGLIEELAAIPRSAYTFYGEGEKPRRKGLVNAFLSLVVPAIRKLIRQVTPEPAPAIARYRTMRETIEACFRVGVVPHTINSKPLDPVAIINSAFCFYLTSLPEVIKQFEGAEAENNVEVRGKWTKRLEDWTMKAVEDSQIKARFVAVHGNGPF
jgi:hypothetical protein